MGGRNVLEDSSVYQALVEKGRLEQTQKLLVALAKKRFQSEAADMEAVIKTIQDRPRLERMFDILSSSDNMWDMLLAIK